MTTVTQGQEQDQKQHGSPYGQPAPVPGAAAREAVDEMVEAGLLDDLMGRIDDGELRLTGQGGFLPEVIKRVLERGLQHPGNHKPWHRFAVAACLEPVGASRWFHGTGCGRWSGHSNWG